MSEKVKIFIELTRLNKPIGFMLLFWPCFWGLTISYDFSLSLNTYFIYAFLFFSGSVLMRSAGCIINDISDRKIDKLVERTKIDQSRQKKFQYLMLQYMPQFYV